MAGDNGSTISHQEMEAWLFEAANILRGPVDPANLRDFVFPLLFLARLSDAWDEEHAQAVEAFGEDVDDEVAADFHKFVIPDDCHWSDLRRVAENHGIELLRIMQSIEAANPDKLAQIFGNAPWADPNKMPPERLERLIEHFNQKYLGPSEIPNDLLGHGYEYLLKEFSDESATSAGQFFTPREVIHLLVRILSPQPADAVYDPACGSAGMLIEAANEVIASGGSVAQMRFYGQEINQTSAAIGRMNLFIHDVEDAQILRGDTLRNPRHLDEDGSLQRFDVVLANPPFIMSDWGAELWATDPFSRAFGGVPPNENGDYAWAQHMIASMKPVTGRIGVVMPHGVLFRPGSEATIREHLVQTDLIDAVIGLPANIFYGTPMETCLLILHSKKADSRRGHVLVIDGSDQFTTGTGQNTLSSDNLEVIYTMYESPETSEFEGSKVRLVPNSQIEANHWNLSISHYLETETDERLSATELIRDLDSAGRDLVKAQELLRVQLKKAGYA